MYQIAIDGTSGSGKSSFAKGLAKATGFYHLNTGDIYRALACAFKEFTSEEPNEDNIAAFIDNIKIEVDYSSGKQVVFINDKDYTPFLRLEETSSFSSKISPFKNLRAKVLIVQREFAEKNNVVMEGRDIGTTILPNAQVKIFLTARPEVRAERRYKELSPEDKAQTSYEEVLADLQERDYRDSHRTVAPLKPAQDSIMLDNSDLNLAQTIEAGIKIVKERIKI